MEGSCQIAHCPFLPGVLRGGTGETLQQVSVRRPRPGCVCAQRHGFTTRKGRSQPTEIALKSILMKRVLDRLFLVQK